MSGPASVKKLGVTFVVVAPVNVTISVSTDGVNYSPLKLNQQKENSKGNIVDIYKASIKKAPVRYIKVVAKNLGTCPKGHPGEGKPAWLFIDEVIVE